jgi:hypothetical protein
MLITYIFRKALKYRIRNILHYSYFIRHFATHCNATNKSYKINILVLFLLATYASLACFLLMLIFMTKEEDR